MRVGRSVTGVSGRIKGEPSQVGRHKDVWLKSSTAFAYHLCSLLVSASAMLLSLLPSFTDSGVSFSKGLQLSRNPPDLQCQAGIAEASSHEDWSRSQLFQGAESHCPWCKPTSQTPLGYILTLLVLFLWRTPTNRVCMVCGERGLTKYKRIKRRAGEMAQ